MDVSVLDLRGGPAIITYGPEGSQRRARLRAEAQAAVEYAQRLRPALRRPGGRHKARQGASVKVAQ